jgi:hypothetical protein
MARARKSKVSRLPAEQRAFVELLLREDRYTLDELVAKIRERYPDADISRSSIHRYQVPLRELTQRMREIDTAARAVVEELGENPDDRAGALLCQSITTLATDAALRANQRDDVSVEEVRKLARAAKDTIDARAKSLKERQAIRQEAREQLLREQSERLSTIEKKRGMTADVADQIRKEILGVA